MTEVKASVDPKEQIVKAVKAYQAQGADKRAKWDSYCDLRNGGIRDPSRHDIGALQAFLQSEGCSILARTDGKISVTSGDAIKDALIGQVKQFQRKGDLQKEQWGHFADSKGPKMRDPSRHDSATLGTFLQAVGMGGAAELIIAAAQMSRGSMGVDGPATKRINLGDGGLSPEEQQQQLIQQAAQAQVVKEQMVTAVQSFTQQGEDKQEQWGAFCDLLAGGVRDANQLDPTIIQQFLASQGIHVSLPANTFPTVEMPTPSTAEQVKDTLVSRVKSFQRKGELQKEQWHAFADCKGLRMRDPSRHDSGSLEAFLETHEGPASTSSDFIIGDATGGIDSMPEYLAVLQEQQTALQLAQQQQAELDAATEMMQQQLEIMQTQIDAAMAAQKEQEEHERQALEQQQALEAQQALVALQKAEEERAAQEAQQQEMQRQQQEAQQRQQQEMQGQMAAQKHQQETHERRHAMGMDDPQDETGPRVVPPPNFAMEQQESQALALVPVEGQGGDTGSMDTDSRNQLVSAVKAFQAQGPDRKEQWTFFCDINLGGIRDPGRHDGAVLQQFLASQGVTLMISNTGRTTVSSGDPQKDSLIARTKQFQRRGDLQKEQWGNFADTKGPKMRDPAKHDSASLEAFLMAYGG